MIGCAGRVKLIDEGDAASLTLDGVVDAWSLLLTVGWGVQEEVQEEEEEQAEVAAVCRALGVAPPDNEAQQQQQQQQEAAAEVAAGAGECAVCERTLGAMLGAAVKRLGQRAGGLWHTLSQGDPRATFGLAFEDAAATRALARLLEGGGGGAEELSEVVVRVPVGDEEELSPQLQACLTPTTPLCAWYRSSPDTPSVTTPVEYRCVGGGARRIATT